jgi:hypothetical protein
MLSYNQNMQPPYYAQPTVPTPIYPEVRKDIEELCVKKNIEIGAAVTKEVYLNDVKVDLLRRKTELQEYRREVAKGNHLEISVGSNGEIEAHVKNAFVKIPTRKISNFHFLKGYELKSSSGEKGFFYLLISLDGGKHMQIFLNTKKMGRIQYFEKKITEVGGVILASTRKERENILIGLWAEICRKSKGIIEVPVREGWISGYDSKYRFVEKGEILWDAVVNLAK